ncbi:deoxyhypusine monooxygenase [Malassezia vespertilionis]|uniref:Deoxyhypusine hydroxylase n=1 Tax=Malassezia vespertilionis TaxID=2020962 RepID=A0A2N1JBG2_9BASI|nr:deoxyhypusine monooxygenase [Malassezia vespertilionis]PKI83884.1 Lia1p [Malassezia vespertilionis]WFD06747.1 deoxyhypusine monooxygenase [Malassezia vespertilionis]
MPPSLDALEVSLLNTSGKVKLDARFRTLFTLKSLASVSDENCVRVISIIGKGFEDDSALLKHELAYVLGQIRDVRALKCLEDVLADEKEHTMVRHEAAEAMGAISSPASLPLLQRYLEADPEVSIRETCHLAINKINFDSSEQGKAERARQEQLEKAHGDAISAASNAAAPIDPAPATVHVPASARAEGNVYSLENVAHFRTSLLDNSLPLFERYRAMFALRNTVQQGSKEAQELAMQALADSLVDPSALFRHEVCFVFGELCHPASVPAMSKVLDDDAEHEMVRHEAAEALGGVLEEATEGGEIAQAAVVKTLTRWAEDTSAPRVVRESCIVALDEIAYNNDPTQFQPMDAVELEM